MTLLWILYSSILGFAVAAIFAGFFKLPRNIYLLIYIPLVAALFFLFIKVNRINISEALLHNWYWGLVGALITGAFVIKNVFTQPSSKKSSGIELLVDIVWSGLTYGLIDALLLSVLPILAIKLSLTDSFWTEYWYGKIGVGTLGLLASFLVTTAYHLGYPEFRGRNVIWPNVGNGVLSLAFIITMSPLAAIVPHMAMHVAAMLHGKNTTGQVPPHYKN
jgi:hypothetical protein